MIDKINNAVTTNEQVAKINEIIDEVNSGGGGESTTGRNIGEIVQSTIPLEDAGLHLLDGSLISGNGVYSDFVDYIADVYNNSAQYYAWGNPSLLLVYTTTPHPTVTDKLYDETFTELTDKIISSVDASYAYINVQGLSITQCNRNTSLDEVAGYFTNETDWQTSVITYGVCGKFVYDSENNTVRLPQIVGFTEGEINTANLGNLTEAGLPNITGTFNYDAWSGTRTGAFYKDGGNKRAGTDTDSGSPGSKTGFNASRSSSIYGNSNTVQPQSIKVLYYIVVANSTKTEIEVDIDNVVTDLNRLDSRLYIKESYSNGGSGYRVWSNNLCEQWYTGYPPSNANLNTSVTFLKAYIDTNYTLITTASGDSAWSSSTSNTQQNSAILWTASTNRKSTTGFYYNRSTSNWNQNWYAIGYIN